MSVLVGHSAPDFTAPAVSPSGDVMDALNFTEARSGKYAAIVFYPLDFTFVCPSELIALDKRIHTLKEKGVEVFGVSVDSHYTHAAWRRTPVQDGGIGNIRFTLVADIDHSIAHAYGVEHPEASVAFRATFLVDKEGIVRHQVVNDLPLGRDMDELIRVVDALQFHEENGEVCPAGWHPGDDGMKATSDGVSSYLKRHAESL